MKQTPAHDNYNPDLLAMMPAQCRRVVEIGCSTGALARAYRSANPETDYWGIEIDPDYAEVARGVCSEVLTGDIETLAETDFQRLFPCDCVVFGDALEHLRDPWSVLRRFRARLEPQAHIVACIPNAQHWSVQVNLACGLLRYADSGLLDRTHLRWFTRITMLELFQSTGFRVIGGRPRIFHEPDRDRFLPFIRAMATTAGMDSNVAVNDALALQYVLVAIPDEEPATSTGTP